MCLLPVAPPSPVATARTSLNCRLLWSKERQHQVERHIGTMQRKPVACSPGIVRLPTCRESLTPSPLCKLFGSAITSIQALLRHLLIPIRRFHCERNDAELFSSMHPVIAPKRSNELHTAFPHMQRRATFKAGAITHCSSWHSYGYEGGGIRSKKRHASTATEMIHNEVLIINTLSKKRRVVKGVYNLAMPETKRSLHEKI